MNFHVFPVLIRLLCQNDKRYMMFDHVPEQREQWVRVRTMFYSSVYRSNYCVVLTGVPSKLISSKIIRPRRLTTEEC